MPQENTQRLPGRPIPNTVADLLSQRKTSRTRSLNDDVEDCHIRLWEQPEYRNYFTPIWREECIEGSFVDDDGSVARMIREYAKEHNFPLAQRANIASLRHSINVVRGRFNLSRKERQGQVSGADEE